MKHLCKGSARCLKRLLDMQTRGEDASEYVFGVMLNGDVASEEYESIRDLARKGMINADLDSGKCDASIFTADGRWYFDDLKDERKERRENMWSNRRFQVFLSFITVIFSTVAGYVAGHI